MALSRASYLKRIEIYINKCLIIYDRFGNFKKRGWIETPLCGGLLFNNIQSVSKRISSGEVQGKGENWVLVMFRDLALVKGLLSNTIVFNSI